MNRSLFLCLLILWSLKGSSQSINTSDIPHFWQAYDSASKTSDLQTQAQIYQQLLINRASLGLQEMIKIRGIQASWYASSVRAHPFFWRTVRPLTEQVQNDSIGIERLMKRYKQLYPAFREPQVYLTISAMVNGGTTTQDKVLIGTEISAADSTVDATGLGTYMTDFLKTNKGVVSMVAHELTHTQQKGGDMEDRRNTNLLGFCLAEGMCDFMAELLLQRPLDNPYMKNGQDHEKAIWTDFQKDMMGKNRSNWLYNGADLGYFVGYSICKAYYQKASNAAQAISHIINLNLEDIDGLLKFLQESGYNGTHV
jgi:hypothetical protein